MAIRLTCECGNVFQVFDEETGQMVRCPVCGRDQVVPKPAGLPGGLADLSAGVPLTQETSGKAIASTVLGIMAIVCMCNLFTGVPAIILGILSLSDIDKSQGRLGGRGLAITGIITGGVGAVFLLFMAVPIALVVPAVQAAREAARRAQCTNNLKQIARALHSYASEHGQFPPPVITGKNGKPLLSWRVAILPYMDQAPLYRRFHLDEPWDSPHNRGLLAQMPEVYLCPSLPGANPNQTTYNAVVGPGAAFEGSTGMPLDRMTDGLTNTILVVEAEGPVDWSKPGDYPLAPNGPIAALRSPHPGGSNVLCADGSVRFVKSDTSQQALRALFTRAGGEAVPAASP